MGVEAQALARKMLRAEAHCRERDRARGFRAWFEWYAPIRDKNRRAEWQFKSKEAVRVMAAWHAHAAEAALAQRVFEGWQRAVGPAGEDQDC